MLHKEQLFKIDNSKRLGTMRIDWYDGKLSNQWNPTELLIELHKSNNIDLKILQKELNYLQFELLDCFEKVLEHTQGIGYNSETILYFVGKFNYAIRLVPMRDAYSYVYVYNK